MADWRTPHTSSAGRAGSRVVLALRALGLGDFLTGVPAYRALRSAFPDERLLLAAPAGLAPLAGLTGAIDEVVDTAALAPVPERLHGAAVAVNLHGKGPQSTALLRATRPRRLITFGDDVGWRPDEHEVHRWCRLLRQSGIPADPADLRIAAPDVPAPAHAHGATLLHPGAASPARRWPPERFAAVARAERAAGRTAIVTGGPGEERLARSVAEASGAVAVTGTDLLGLAALVAAAGRLVCGDTGVAHLATALGTPSIVLFGPVPPAEWGPPPDERHVALWRGRRGDPHGAEPDPGLLEIEVEDVCQSLDRLTEV